MSFHQEKYNQSHCADSSPSTMSDLVTLCGTRSLALEALINKMALLESVTEKHVPYMQFTGSHPSEMDKWTTPPQVLGEGELAEVILDFQDGTNFLVRLDDKFDRIFYSKINDAIKDSKVEVCVEDLGDLTDPTKRSQRVFLTIRSMYWEDVVNWNKKQHLEVLNKGLWSVEFDSHIKRLHYAMEMKEACILAVNARL